MSGGVRGLQTRSEAVNRLWQVRLLPSPPFHGRARGHRARPGGARARSLGIYSVPLSWQVPQALVYGIGIALPGSTPFTAAFVLRGTSKRCEVMSFIQ